MAQQIKLPGCPTVGQFTAKSGNNAFLAVKMAFFEQPENSIC